MQYTSFIYLVLILLQFVSVIASSNVLISIFFLNVVMKKKEKKKVKYLMQKTMKISLIPHHSTVKLMPEIDMKCTLE